MKVIHMLKGLPASGKTTLALKMVEEGQGQVKRVNKDELRKMLDGGKYSTYNEKFVNEVRNLIIEAAIAHGFDAVVDDTNLNPKHEEEMYRLSESIGATLRIVKMDASVEECIRRDKLRDNCVGSEVIIDMHNMWLKEE